MFGPVCSRAYVLEKALIIDTARVVPTLCVTSVLAALRLSLSSQKSEPWSVSRMRRGSLQEPIDECRFITNGLQDEIRENDLKSDSEKSTATRTTYIAVFC